MQTNQQCLSIEQDLIALAGIKIAYIWIQFSLVECVIWEHEVAGSSPVIQTKPFEIVLHPLSAIKANRGRHLGETGDKIKVRIYKSYWYLVLQSRATKYQRYCAEPILFINNYKCGYSLMAKHLISNQKLRVQFPLSAPFSLYV